jgi:hypothetical protein
MLVALEALTHPFGFFTLLIIAFFTFLLGLLENVFSVLILKNLVDFDLGINLVTLLYFNFFLFCQFLFLSFFFVSWLSKLLFLALLDPLQMHLMIVFKEHIFQLSVDLKVGFLVFFYQLLEMYAPSFVQVPHLLDDSVWNVG